MERIIIVSEMQEPSSNGNVCIVSVHNNKLIITHEGSTHLYVLDVTGNLLSTLFVADRLFDVTWTPRGDMVYSTCDSHQVVTISEAGDVIGLMQMKDPRCFSVSNDDVIYIADWQNGIFQSTDGGMTWCHTFSLPEEKQCIQVIKVTTEAGDVFWVLEKFAVYSRLRIYSITENQSTSGDITWRDVDLMTSRGLRIVLSWNSRLTYDGGKLMFLTELENSAVHVLSVDGVYQHQLLSSEDVSTPYGLSVDRHRKLMYVGPSKGVVKVFALT